MNIVHHLDDATLVTYASGNLGEAHGLLVEGHLSLCAECRSNLLAAERLGGAVLEFQTGEAVSDLCRSATLASLDGFSKPSAKPKPVHGELPSPIARALGGKSLGEIKWKKKAPGVAVFDIPLSAGSKTHLKLLSIGPGRAMPEHGHGGEEITLVLKGAFKDHTGRYGKGDVADLDEDVEHMPVVDGDETCICLVATEAPTRFKSFWAKLFQPFVGI